MHAILHEDDVRCSSALEQTRPVRSSSDTPSFPLKVSKSDHNGYSVIRKNSNNEYINNYGNNCYKKKSLQTFVYFYFFIAASAELLVLQSHVCCSISSCFPLFYEAVWCRLALYYKRCYGCLYGKINLM